MLRERMSTFMELGSYRKRPECCGKRTVHFYVTEAKSRRCGRGLRADCCQPTLYQLSEVEVVV